MEAMQQQHPQFVEQQQQQYDAESFSQLQQQDHQQQQTQHFYFKPRRNSGPHWPATAELQRPAPPPSLLSLWLDRKTLAGLLLILLTCAVALHRDFGVDRPELVASAHLSSPHSTSYSAVPIYSSVLGVDMAAEVMLMEFKVQQQGPAVTAACSGPNASRYELAVWPGTPGTAPPAAVLPLCPPPAAASAASVGNASSSSSSSSHQQQHEHAVYTVPIPLVKLSVMTNPFEEMGAEVRLVLRCNSGAGGSPSSGAASAAGGICSGRNTPGVFWTAHWAAPDMQVAFQRHMSSLHMSMIDAADVFVGGLDERSIPHMEALGLHRTSSEAMYRLEITRSSDVRVLQLLFALVQVVVILYCLLMGVGQVLWAYVLSRLLCMRGHMTAARRESRHSLD